MNTLNRMKRRTLLAAISLVPSLAFTATDIGTLTVGHTAVLLPPSMAVCIFLLDGYQGGGFGSYSPTGLTGGKVVNGVYDTTTCSGTFPFARFEVRSFSSDPGKNWLTSISCNGVTLPV